MIHKTLKFISNVFTEKIDIQQLKSAVYKNDTRQILKLINKKYIDPSIDDNYILYKMVKYGK